MYTKQIEERAGRRRLRWKTGRLDNYMLRFNKKSDKDGTGKANVVPGRGAVVWGVAFDLGEEEFKRVKAHEDGYEQMVVEIFIPDEDSRLCVKTFIAKKPKERDLSPTRSYIKRIIEGARQHDLPDDYCQKIDLNR